MFMQLSNKLQSAANHIVHGITVPKFEFDEFEKYPKNSITFNFLPFFFTICYLLPKLHNELSGSSFVSTLQKLTKLIT